MQMMFLLSSCFSSELALGLDLDDVLLHACNGDAVVGLDHVDLPLDANDVHAGLPFFLLWGLQGNRWASRSPFSLSILTFSTNWEASSRQRPTSSSPYSKSTVLIHSLILYSFFFVPAAALSTRINLPSSRKEAHRAGARRDLSYHAIKSGRKVLKQKTLYYLFGSSPKICCCFSLQTFLPLLSIPFVFCIYLPSAVVFQVVSFRFFCFFWPQLFVDVVFPSFLGLPTDLFVPILLSGQGFLSIILLVHRSCGEIAILIAILHFSLLCVSIQRGSFTFFHVIFGFFRAPFDDFYPFLFFFFFQQ